jgi:glycosyltransferase involved in cell wall biosynthesis
MAELTAIILTRNEAHNIAACINSLRWANRIVVFDSYSDDQTVAVAAETGAETFQRSFDNYAAQRNAALEAISTEWVLFVDADERGTPALAEEVRRVIDERPESGW